MNAWILHNRSRGEKQVRASPVYILQVCCDDVQCGSFAFSQFRLFKLSEQQYRALCEHVLKSTSNQCKLTSDRSHNDPNPIKHRSTTAFILRRMRLYHIKKNRRKYCTLCISQKLKNGRCIFSVAGTSRKQQVKCFSNYKRNKIINATTQNQHERGPVLPARE